MSEGRPLFAARRPSAEAARPLRERSERIAGRVPPLQAAAERIAATVQQGVHGRRQVGQGEAFWQFRRYELGDSPSMIDWRQSGRSEHVFVRENEWDAAQSVWFHRDRSASMNWASSPELETKRVRADLLMLATAILLIRAGERVALPEAGGRPMAGRSTIGRLADVLDRSRASDAADGSAGAGAERDAPPAILIPRHASFVWISDFLSPVAAIAETMRTIAARGVSGVMLQILDPAEEDLPYDGRIRFSGVEGEPDLIMSRVESVRSAYHARMSARNETLADTARRIGWHIIRHRTDHSPQIPLLSLHALVSGAPNAVAVGSPVLAGQER